MILLVIRIPARLVSFLVEHFEWCLLLAALFVIAGVLATIPHMPR